MVPYCLITDLVDENDWTERRRGGITQIVLRTIRPRLGPLESSRAETVLARIKLSRAEPARVVILKNIQLL